MPFRYIQSKPKVYPKLNHILLSWVYSQEIFLRTADVCTQITLQSIHTLMVKWYIILVYIENFVEVFFSKVTVLVSYQHDNTSTILKGLFSTKIVYINCFCNYKPDKSTLKSHGYFLLQVDLDTYKTTSTGTRSRKRQTSSTHLQGKDVGDLGLTHKGIKESLHRT